MFHQEIENGHEPTRGIGKSTARMLISISEALLCPGEWFAVVDHNSGRQAECIKQQLENVIDILRLKMDVVIHDGVVHIRSSIAKN